MSLDDLFSLKNRVIVITGGGGLLGARHAEAIAEANGIPVIVDRTAAAADAVAKDIGQRFDVPVLGVTADITSPEDVGRMVDSVVASFGRIDGLVNNAALTVKSGSEDLAGYFAPFEEYRLDLWERALRVNLTGMFLCTQAVGRVLKSQRSGVIVNIASVAGVVGPDHRIYEGIRNQYGGEAFNTPVSYSTTKTAVLGFTRYLATYWAKENIRVNALSPGGVFDDHDETFVKAYSYRVPLGRMANRDEYKGGLIFLCSDASSYMTGANLVVDGGWTAW